MGKLFVEGVDLTELLGVPYVASRHPGNTSVEEFLKTLDQGGNCQLFSLGVLWKRGLRINSSSTDTDRGQGKRFGSKELWEDTLWTQEVFVCPDSGNWESQLSFCGEASRTFNLFFFWPKDVGPSASSHDFKRLHVGVCVGSLYGSHSHCVLHNPAPGPSAVWRLSDFLDNGYRPFGIKRPTVKVY